MTSNLLSLTSAAIVLLIGVGMALGQGPSSQVGQAVPDKHPDTNYCQRLQQEIQSKKHGFLAGNVTYYICLLYTSPSPRDATLSRMPSSA